jgi:hypothetical protein
MSAPTPTPTPFTPSVGDVQSRTQKGILALKGVTTCCHGVSNTTLTALDPPPDWYATLSANLDTAKTHAANWIDNLAPDLTATVPTAIINYGSLLDAAAEQIEDLLTQAQQPGADQQDLVNQAMQIVQAMQQQVQANQTSIQNVKDQVIAFGKLLQADHDALFDSATSIQKAEAADQNLVDQMTTNIANLRAAITFANKQLTASEVAVVSGIFMLVAGLAVTVASVGTAATAGAVVMGVGIATVVGGAAGWAYWQSQINDDYSDIATDTSTENAATQQILALTSLSASVGTVMDLIDDANDRLSDVAYMWSGFNDLVTGVLTDLGKEKADVTKIAWDKVWVGGAHNEWDKLQDIATQLLNMPVATDQKSFSLPQAA